MAFSLQSWRLDTALASYANRILTTLPQLPAAVFNQSAYTADGVAGHGAACLEASFEIARRRVHGPVFGVVDDESHGGGGGGGGEVWFRWRLRITEGGCVGGVVKTGTQRLMILQDRCPNYF